MDPGLDFRTSALGLISSIVSETTAVISSVMILDFTRSVLLIQGFIKPAATVGVYPTGYWMENHSCAGPTSVIRNGTATVMQGHITSRISNVRQASVKTPS